MARKAQAQAQAQKQAEINATESFNLVRGLLRVSIFHVSFLRGLFPESSYRNVEMGNLGGMNIRMLTPACNESKRLIDWVEQGVQDALQKGYLKTLFFGISSDAEGTSLLEEYIFNFSHDKQGGLRLDLAASNGKDFSSSAVQAQGAVNNVKFQVVRLMRMLVQICQTLDYVPPERYLFMKMTYHPNTPEEYEPPGFRGVDEEKLGYFSRKPFAMDVGTVATPYHGVILRVKSMLDSCGYGEDGQEEADAQSMQNSTLRRAASRALTESDGQDGDQESEQLEDATAAAPPPSPAALHTSQDEMMEEAEAPEELLAAVEAFCRRRSTVEAADILSEFLQLPQAQLDSTVLPALLKRAVLESTGQPDKYQVVGAASKAKADKTAVTAAAKRLEGLAVTGTATAAPHAPHEETPDSDQEGGSSQLGRVQTSNAGTNATFSAAAGGPRTARALGVVAAPNGELPPDSQPPEPVFFESQQSLDGSGLNGKRRVRKASYVEAPIHQAAKKARTGGASTRATPRAQGVSMATSRRNAPRGKAR